MSYILEALKRADRERAQGHVPGLHSQQASYLEAPADDEPRVSPAQGWMLGGVALAGLGAATWLWLQDDPAPPPSAAPPLAARQPAAVRPANVPPVAVAAAPAVLPAAPPPALRLEPPRPLPKPKAPVVAAAQPDGAAAPMAKAPLAAAPGAAAPGAAAPVSNTARAAAPIAAAQPTAPSGATASPPNAAKAAVPGPMPEEVRRELPALGISGSVYSDRPADRMLIVNGQVLRERDELAPGFMLERIQAKSAIVLHKGQRYVINF